MVVLRVKEHIIQRMIVRFLSQSVDVGVIVGVAIDAMGDVSPVEVTAFAVVAVHISIRRLAPRHQTHTR